MRCVNKRSKDFKRLAEHYNVSIDQLELYTHKYWIETGNEDSFPTAVYIAAQMGKMPYYEQSDSVREFWERHYSTPREYTTKEGWQKAYNEAKTYFPEHALVTYSNTKGNYVLAVRKPVDTIKPNIDDFIKWNAVEQQDKEDYQLITDNLVSELEKNRNFAQAKKLRTRLSNERRANRQLDTTLASIDNAVQSGQWSEAAIGNLNNLVKSIKDGRIHFQRTVGERRSLAQSISDIHEGASIILRASYGTSPKKQGNSQAEYKRDAKQGKEQEKVIEAWAKAADLWLNDYTDEEGNKANSLDDLLNSQWKMFDYGSEATAYLYDSNTLLKSINLSHSNDNVAKALDSIALFNQQFPESALNVVGFGRDELGHFKIIALQDLVEGQELTEEDWQDFTAKYEDTYGRNKNEEVSIYDLGHNNILKDKNGYYHVIDADAIYKTPEKGGNVRFSNRIYVAEEALEDNANEFDDLQMSIENRKRPTTFTFNDGTTVQAPFQVNQQQKDALNAMNDFIHSDETSMTLSGYAGTGKTSLMEMLAKKMQREHRRIVFSATTNKAAAVLKARVKNSGFDAYTLNRVFGIGVEVDSNKQYDARNLVNVIKESDIISPGDVVVIDEASMINESNYKILNQIAKENGLQIIYVGDKAQLAPVNETEVSKVFRSNGNKVVELTQVERTDDNAILKEATAIRNGEKLSGESSFNDKGEGVAYIPQSHRKEIGDVIKHFVPGLKKDPNYFRILAYTNAAVAKYNEAVRRTLGYTGNIPQVGEPMIGYANWGYNYRNKTYKFINSESYKVTKVGKPKNVEFRANNTAVRMEAIPITLEDSMGNSETFNFMDIKGNAKNKRIATWLAQEKSKLWEKARHLTGRAKADVLGTINDIDSFLFVNDDITEGKRTLQGKVIDFGYALTVHKSQGSTFTHVLMDDVGFDAANATQIDEGEELDLGITDYSPEPQQAIQAAPNNDKANIRQQLEYVGVSRATDTVTIISNDVKKEDTPLNHIVEKPVTPEKPVQQMNRRELWKHVESWAEPVGERPVFYTPVGKTRRQYTVRNGKVYNKEGKEVQYKGKDVNRILANLAIMEGRGVVVDYRGAKYVVDNHKNITSVTSGDVVYKNENDGNRKAIVLEAEKAFRNLIAERQETGKLVVPEMIKYLKAIYPDRVFNQVEMKKYIDEHGLDSVQQAIEESKEMQAIKQQTIADGTFMKAPNGKDTNLTENQWLQVRTKNFKNWFGDWENDSANASKVVDENGEPFIAYTGTTGDFTVFDSKYSRTASKGFFFTVDKDIASSEGRIKEVFLNIRNLKEEATESSDFDTENGKYDGVSYIYKNAEAFVVWNPNQIKSATDNIGTFSTENDDTRMFATPEGEIYGFVDPQGNIYLDERAISPEHPIHEYTHVWDRLVAKNNPRLWKRGVALMKQISLWNEIAEDANYGQKWKALKGMTDAKLESLIASEVHSRLVGKQGEALLNRIAKEKGSKGIIGKLKQWILDFWKDVKATFSNWSDEEINSLTLDDFNKMTVRDFADGITSAPETTQTQQTQQLPGPETKINIYAGTGENADLSNFANRPFHIDNHDTALVSENGMDFTSVEQAFQYHKLLSVYDELDDDKFNALSKELKNAKTGASAKAIGRRIPMSAAAISNWNNQSSDVMKELLKASFDQNPQALQRLLATGDATLTHTQDKGKWGTEFPRLLMKVRSELRSEQLATVNQQTQQPVSFTESTGGYPQRTRENITWSDVTLAFANDDTTAGEKLTEREANKQGKYLSEYLPDTLDINDIKRQARNQVIGMQNDQAYGHKGKVLPIKNIKLNIAGNGIYTLLPKGITQEQLNDYVTEYIKELMANGVTISEIRSGGQTGVDEAGIIAAQRLGIPASVHAPKGFTFRTADGKDISDRSAFESRFNQIQQITQDTQQQAVPETSENIFSEEEGARVSLPGYEYFNDQYEDTLVDAEWKIPMLQELDSQLSNDNTEEENQRILDRMDTILAATSEQELYPNTTVQEEKTINTTLNDYDRLNAQIDNLNNSDFISSSEVRHAAELIMNAVSDEVTRMQKEKGFAEKIFPSLKVNEDFNFQTATRKEIIETVGLPRLLDRAKELFNTEKVDFDDLSIEQQADVIYDNFDGILHFGTDIFAMNEGFGIKRNYRTNTYEVAESMEMNLDDEGNYNDTATTEEEEDLQEHWQIEQRTLDVLASATELVRMAIHECYQIDEKGNKVKSAWGIYERVNPREAVKNILRWTRGAQSLPDMVAMLERKKTDNPWLTQLINRLNDKSGNEADLQSQFYGVMKKSRQSYNITQLENGKYIVNFVNNNKSRKAIFNGIVAKLAMKEHPLFKKGIDRGLLGYKDKVGKDEDITLYKALYDLKAIEDRLNHKERLNSDMIDEAANNIEAAYKILGYVPLDNAVRASITEDNIKHMAKQLGYIVNALEDEAQYEHQHTNATPYEPLTYKARNSIEGALKKFLDPVADILDDSATNVVFEDGKMYQEDVTPSYLTLLFEKFHLDEKEFQKFIKREYGSSEWFKMKGSGPQTGWRFGWLKKLAADPEARKLFDQTVELNFNKHRYMKNMTPAEYAVSMIAHYFASDVENTAWFRVPMQSNKPSSEFIRFYAFKDANYKDSIVDEYYNLFLQELSRIQTVNMRNRSKNDPDFIKNWDTNGRKFNFLSYLNSYLKNSKDVGNLLRNAEKDKELARILRAKENLEELTAEDEAKLPLLVQEAIKNYMEEKASGILDMWERTGILEAAKKIQGIGKEDAEVRAALENFVWNDNYASVNILQLTVGDIAAYKDADDLQKRLAELHAPGIRANIYATDYKGKGNRVSDGKYRTVILKDFDDFVSNVVANISEVFDRKIAAARTEQEKRGLRALKDSLVRPRTYNADGSIKDKGGKYWNINVADAQGYSSPSSYRKKALMFGRWSRHSEDVYQKLLSGEYNFTDLETAFQPLKPFVYSQLHKDVGITGEVESPIQTMNMPFQAKNAEYLLIMADALTRNEKTSRPNLLRAIFRVMEDSERLNPTMGIDTVQFESAIKSGLQGAMDIHQFMNTLGGEEAAYTYMMNQMYQRGEDGLRSRQYNTRTFVHETSYDSYCLQQEVPAHFDNHHQAQGSQERMIIPSDLDVYKDPNGNREDEANKVYYEWNDPDGTHRKEDAQTFRREYERTISDNIEMSLDELVKEFKLDTADTRVRNIALSEILQKEILDNPRYGIELFQACSVDKKTGEFRIPKGDPIQAKRIEQLINSIIKTKVNKQEIAGGPIVQVSNFGTSTQLRIRFNARSGGILKSEDEFTPTEKYKTYDEYKKAEQAGIAYFEVFAPMWMKEKLFNEFADNNGNIDVDAIEAVDPELLKMISYRIPTEDKYSIAPMKVVGFLPKEAGDAIMFPYELTEIDDSDFDVDKRYVMRKELNIVKAKRKDLQYVLENKLTESWERGHKDQKIDKKWVKETVREFLDNPQKMRSTDRLMASLWKEYVRQAYYTEAPESKRAQNNNKVLDMTWGVLTNEMTADKILNPGGFDNFKGIGYKIAAYKNSYRSWEELQEMSNDKLKELSTAGQDLTFIDAQLHYYQQNAAGSNLIGVFAVNKVAHATLEGDHIFIAVNELCGDAPFTIAGKTFSGRMEIDPKYDDNGNLIGKTIGSGVSASADTAKEPVLDLMNINMSTAGIFNTLLRLGMPLENAALFMSQNVIKEVLDEFNRQNLSGSTSLNRVIEERLKTITEEAELTEESKINTEELTEEELIRGLKSGDTVVDYKILKAFQKIRSLASVLRNPTFATRFNSITSAVGPLIIDNLVMKNKMDNFTYSEDTGGTNLYLSDGTPVDIHTIFSMHPILDSFSKGMSIAEDMFRDMPAGSIGFDEVIQTLPGELKDKVMGDKKILSRLSDFYQSYLLVQAELINPNAEKEGLRWYIEEFPKWFEKNNIQAKYPDNALVQDIAMTVSKKTGRTFMNVDTLGLKEPEKEKYRSAWTDLHKTDPDLSMKLLTYWFFRGGIGFSPKTSTGLIPNFVKENFEVTLDNGEKVSYLDVFRRLPAVNPEIVIDQFIRNNWEESKLVPKKGGKNTHYSYDRLRKGILEIYSKEDIESLEGVTWMRTRHNNQTYLWKLIGENAKGNIEYQLVKPLGDNAEYLEMSTENIINPMSETTLDVEDWESSERTPTSPAEDVDSEASKGNISEAEKSEDISKMADLIQNYRARIESPVTAEAAQKQVNTIKDSKNQKQYVKFLSNVLKSNGIEVSEDEVLKKFNELC